MKTYSREVGRGIRWLDKNYPGWYQIIDVETLKLEDCQRCVLGQLGDFMETVEDAVMGQAHTKEGIRWSRIHGFAIGMGSLNRDWINLTNQWKTAIERIRNAVA